MAEAGDFSEVDDGPTEQLGMFCSLFEPYSHTTEDADKLRKVAFRSADPNGNGFCSLAELEGFILTELVGAYPTKKIGDPATGRDLFDLYRPCYVLAFNDAKDYKADSGKVPEGTQGATDDDFVSFGEFRLFCAYLCIYCCMFDAFSKIDGGGSGRGGDDRKMDLGEWVKGYRRVSGYPFVALEMVTTDKEAEALFGRIDSNGGGFVILEKFCTFLKDAEVAAGTEMGETLAADEPGGVGTSGATLSQVGEAAAVDTDAEASAALLAATVGGGSGEPVLSEHYNHYAMTDAKPNAKPKPELTSSSSPSSSLAADEPGGVGTSGATLSQVGEAAAVDTETENSAALLAATVGGGLGEPVLSEHYNHYAMTDANPNTKPKPELTSSSSSVGLPDTKEAWMGAAHALPAAKAYPAPDEFAEQLASVIDQLTAVMAKMDGKAELKELFDALDKNGDGKVSGQEWGKAVGANQELLAKYFGGSTLIEIGSAFRRLDTDNSGTLSWDEFEAALDTWAEGTANVELLAMAMATDDGRSELRELFESMDKNGDGKVSGQEWGKAVGANQELLAKYFGGSTLIEIGSAFRRLDTDNSGTLTWDEFEAALYWWDSSSTAGVDKLASIVEEDETKAELEELFEKLDKDGDGKVTGQEWGRSVAGDKDVMARLFGGSTLKEIGTAFRRIDVDKSGALSWSEFSAALEAHKLAIKLDVLWGSMPKNEQGEVERLICWEIIQADDEVSALIGSGDLAKGKAMLAAMKDSRALDISGNGQIAPQEYKRLLNAEVIASAKAKLSELPARDRLPAAPAASPMSAAEMDLSPGRDGGSTLSADLSVGLGRPPKPSRKKAESKDPLNPYSKEARASSLPRAKTPAKPVHGGRVSCDSRPKSRSVSRPSGAPTAFTMYDSSRLKDDRDSQNRAIMKARIEAAKENRREDSRLRRDDDSRKQREHMTHMREQSLIAQRMKEDRDAQGRKQYRASKDADHESRHEQKRLMKAKRVQDEREYLENMRSQSALKTSMRDETAQRERRETNQRQQSAHASRKEMSESHRHQTKLKETELLAHAKNESKISGELKASREAKDAEIKKAMTEANRESRLAAKTQTATESANSNRDIMEMNKRLIDGKQQAADTRMQRERAEKKQYDQARLGATVLAGSGSSLDGT